MIGIEKLAEHNNIIIATIGGLFMLLATWINSKGKKTKGDADNCLKALSEIEKKVSSLKISLRQERKNRGIVEGNWEGFKYAFNVFYDESEEKFKDHPEHMVMMKSLKRILDK